MKTNQTGRSMVEMLGVLAIMGILSLAGMKAFTMAMNKLNANKISELVGEISADTQLRRSGTCLNLTTEEDFLELQENDAGTPKCVTKMQAGTTGQVKVFFDTENADCTALAKMVAASFGRCRWVEHTVGEDANKKVDYGIFVPGRAYMCAVANKDGSCKEWGECTKSSENEDGDIVCESVVNKKGYSLNHPCSDYTPDGCFK